jgi:putative phosphoribosyl transferase
VVDDGIATGSTAEAACQVARAQGARQVILAVPVGPKGIAKRLRPEADQVICLHTPANFFAVGQAYEDFRQTSDEEVVDLLERAARGAPAPESARVDPPQTELTVPVGRVQLPGRLSVPDGAAGLVVFAHGSGSSRHSPRNRYVADFLNAAGLGTLLFDLLTLDEEVNRRNVFDIELLGGRLRDVTAWLRTRADVPQRIGYFGASTGAAAALYAAAEPDADVMAVVSRGGRPDLAGEKLGLVRAATLLIVGGHDEMVLALNRTAQARLRCETRLEVVPGATHLFEEPGALGAVARHARDWFTRHLAATASRA